MGMLVDGKWSDVWYEPDKKGRFVRSTTQFRDWIGSGGESRFAPAAGRYHLYVSLACPWAHRTLIMRRLKNLTEAISISIVDPMMLEGGWFFSTNPGCIADSVNAKKYMWEIYTAADAKYSGRVTVPVLWDKERSTIVNNESLEIIKMFDQDFGSVVQSSFEFYPEALRSEIDQVVAEIYEPINNGVYKSGFATTQAAYEEAVVTLFGELDRLEEVLNQQRYLVGSQITLADWCLFTTLLRFDPVYVGHFKCNKKRIFDYANLWNYMLELYQIPGVQETCNFDHIKRHYYGSHASVNPTKIVPLGPEFDLSQPHNRNRVK
jgi:putative glutathione S-transferase